MKGTEKQIAWAEDLKKKAIAAIESIVTEGSPSEVKAAAEHAIAQINAVEYAGKIIEAFSYIVWKGGDDDAKAVLAAGYMSKIITPYYNK